MRPHLASLIALGLHLASPPGADDDLPMLGWERAPADRDVEHDVRRARSRPR